MELHGECCCGIQFLFKILWKCLITLFWMISLPQLLLRQDSKQNKRTKSMKMEEQSSSQKSVQKVDKKTYKAVTKAEKDVGKIMSKEPTEILMLCNSGLMTGATFESVFEAMSKFGKVKNVTLVPGKSFCFVSFHEKSECQKVYEDCNGQKSLLHSNNPIYMSYITQIPEKFKNLEPFWASDDLPEGLQIIPDFIDESEEIQIIQGLNWQKSEQGNLKHRQVLHFGKEFIYGSNTISQNSPEKVQPFPQSWKSFLENVTAKGLQNRFPDQCTVNKYLPGQGIPPHVDNHECCDDSIMSLSLLSEVTMDFIDLDDKKVFHVNLPRRSLMIMSGKARYAFTHGITPRKSDIIVRDDNLTLRPREERISLTFRKSLERPFCNCKFARHCPSQSEKLEEMNEEAAGKLEKLHVHQVYEKIADHFSETRHKPWPKVVNFLQEKLEANPGSILVDVGCGNGKYLDGLENVLKLGLDYSRNLLGFVKAKKGCDAVRSDILAIPLRDEMADACISIAVIHHLSTEERRMKAIQEIHRVLKVGSCALIYAWAKEQEVNEKPSTYLLQSDKSNEESPMNKEITTESNIRLPVHENRTNFKHNDLLVPWKNKKDEETFHRFYHVFKKGELEALVKKALESSRIHIESLYYDQGNWCIIFQKLEGCNSSKK